MGRMAPRVPSVPDLRELLYMLGVGSVTWYAIIVVLPLLAVAARRINTTRGRATLIAVVTTVLLFLTTAVIDFLITYRGVQAPGFVNYLPVALRLQLLPWIAVVGIVTVIEMRRRAIQSRLEGERLRSEVAEQRLIALTGQLQPHFLFNTLQGISTLIHRDPNAADEMLSRLSELLRDLLRHRDSPMITLDDELRYIRTYLEISQFRFSDRLSFAIESPRDVTTAKVPLFILQPLVENALAHGIGPKAKGGTIKVCVERNGDRLAIDVSDDGAGISPSLTAGVGIPNTRERLVASYGSSAALTLHERTGGGTVARIEIPYRT
jgi:LytS/YehU family sensor histidine kinase